MECFLDLLDGAAGDEEGPAPEASTKARHTGSVAVFKDDIPAVGAASSPDHLAALDRHGPSPQHRFSFAPVRARIQGDLF